ncbi:MAG: CocE/NonD family hydrolase [Gemmatimonadetes bacterium]|nr:CocE/NonD family hydrolase [Gemmatimonadota bacterium]
MRKVKLMPNRPLFRGTLLGALALAIELGPGLIGAPLLAQTAAPFDIPTHYQKHEYQIPMRDGVKLFTAVYVPRDTTTNWPILLSRTPYSARPYGVDAYPRSLGPGPNWAQEGYIFVTQDVRGRYRSEGHFVHMTPHQEHKGPKDVDESTDTWDTIDWLVKHVPHNNGRVGLWGISYPGFFAVAGMIDAHPALKAVSPEAPQADWFMGDDTRHNGAFFLASTFNFMYACGRLGTGTSMTCGQGFDFGTQDGYKFFLDMGPLPTAEEKYFKGQSPGWTAFMEHGTYDDFWKARTILPHLKNIRPAVLTVGGWYDANNFYGALHVFEAIEKQSPSTDNAIVIGPWSHGQWYRNEGSRVGQLTFGSKTSEEFQTTMLLPFFDDHLKGKGTHLKGKAFVYETGGNRWHTLDSWPPKQAVSRAIYLDTGATLSYQPPGARETPADAYVSDPANPVPFVPGPSTDMDPDYMAQDQRFVSARPDVLFYQGPPLTEELTVAGPVSPTLFVSSNGTDGDWIVKVIDVHPDGFQELVRGDVARAKFRNSFEKPEPLVPGQVAQLDFTMLDVYHTFQKGHRIMVQVQSSWFPLVDRNPQTFVDIYHARAADFQKATVRVYRSGARASRVTMSVLP